MEDEIVEEMDVFLNSSLSSKLHIFQFPNGFSPLNEDKGNLLSMKAKIESKKFQMEIKIDTTSQNYDKKKSEHIASITEDEDDPFFPNKYMNKWILDSDELKPNVLQYAAGVIKRNSKEVHLSPISSVIHFRPSFEYFDRDPKKINKKFIIENINNDNSKEVEIKRIIPRFERPDEERIKKARESSFSFLTQKLYSEPWVDVNVNFRDSITSLIEKQSLIYTQSNNEFTDNFVNQNLFESIDNQKNFKGENGILSLEDCLKSFMEPQTTHCISFLGKLDNIPLSTKVRTILLNAKVISFSHLKQILSDNTDASSIIRKLQEYAMLVQGNWVVKSEILYPKEAGKALISPVTGIPIEVLCRARDFIIWSFTQESSLSRLELIKKTKIPDQEVLFILKEISELNKSTKMWDFILPKDVDFLLRYPEIVQRQSLLWEARYIQLNKSYMPSKSKKTSETVTKKNCIKEKTPTSKKKIIITSNKSHSDESVLKKRKTGRKSS